jgi:hypothetical protein
LIIALAEKLMAKLDSQTQVIFVSLFLPPSQYLDIASSPFLHLLDLSGFIRGYSDEEPDILSLILAEIASGECSQLSLKSITHTE